MAEELRHAMVPGEIERGDEMVDVSQQAAAAGESHRLAGRERLVARAVGGLGGEPGARLVRPQAMRRGAGRAAVEIAWFGRVLHHRPAGEQVGDDVVVLAVAKRRIVALLQPVEAGAPEQRLEIADAVDGLQRLVEGDPGFEVDEPGRAEGFGLEKQPVADAPALFVHLQHVVDDHVGAAGLGEVDQPPQAVRRDCVVGVQHGDEAARGELDGAVAGGGRAAVGREAIDAKARRRSWRGAAA